MNTSAATNVVQVFRAPNRTLHGTPPEMPAAMQALTHATAAHREVAGAFPEKRKRVFRGD